tara:strand:+ start:442 stop:1608 length:1167 start_codon:yes stop_codon:yes gene_type:complete
VLFCNIAVGKILKKDRFIILMSKALNQIELGTSCVVKETGQPGTLQRIFYYPTKYLIKSENGEFNYYTTHEISFEGYDRSNTTLNIPEVPHNGVGERLASFVPFEAISLTEHHFLSSKEILWEMLTSLETYNLWFTGIQRAIADVKSKRYVHKFSFDQLPLKPGSYFKIRPATLAPWFRCRIITVEKEKEFGFDFRMSPLFSEYISFTIEESKTGVFVTCTRTSKGLFSFLSLYNWNKNKSKILEKLAAITPVISTDINTEEVISSDSTGSTQSNQLSREDTIALVVNKALDGDKDSLNALSDKITRGKAKALIIRINRGTAERPPIPNKPSAASKEIPETKNKNDDELMERLIASGLKGDMEEINALDNKVLRGKIKAAIVKAKRKN